MPLLLKPVDTLSFPDVAFLYAVLGMRLTEPKANISHTKLPEWHEHINYINNPPYRRYDIVVVIHSEGDVQSERIGISYITKADAVQQTIGDEVGIYLMPAYRKMGIGTKIIQQYQAENDYLCANIAKTNKASKAFFGKHGFVLARKHPKQLVYAWRRT